jgi:hypothetical protein
MDQVQFTPEHWRQFWANYKGEPHQQAAIELLRQHLSQSDPALLTDSAEWVTKWREREPAPADFPNTWEGVEAAARVCGARFPELVAAQWALESAHGTAMSGKWNAFGIKGSGTNKSTQEFVDGHYVTITAGFIDFPTLKDCVNYLVTRWYLDYKGYKGVNHCATAEEAAHELKRQGYATDPVYPEKLIRLMHQHG